MGSIVDKLQTQSYNHNKEIDTRYTSLTKQGTVLQPVQHVVQVALVAMATPKYNTRCARDYVLLTTRFIQLSLIKYYRLLFSYLIFLHSAPIFVYS